MTEPSTARKAPTSPVEATEPQRLPEIPTTARRAVDEAVTSRRERAAQARAEARRHWPVTVDITEQARALLLTADYLAHYASAVRSLHGRTPTEDERQHMIMLAVSVTEQGRLLYSALSGRQPSRPEPANAPADRPAPSAPRPQPQGSSQIPGQSKRDSGSGGAIQPIP